MVSRKKSRYSDELSVVLCGEAGQGIQTIEQTLATIVKQAGYHVFSTKEYMSRVRGGNNSTQIRISPGRVSAAVNRIDILVALGTESLAHLESRITASTLILGEKEIVGSVKTAIEIPFSQIAAEIGGKIYANTVAVGVVLGIIGINRSKMEKYFRKRFASKNEEIINHNIEAGKRGYEQGRMLVESGPVEVSLGRGENIAGELLLNGAEAVTFGAIAGGCDFVSSYPMSPSTGVLAGCAKYSHDFGIIVEQAEDEIAAINMALGAWYAGARALVTTSGGGFALMCEGMSLAGCIESPLVVHLAQRPGPATGLPTRTEQGDLDLALYAGHGEFPRVIYAPGTMEQAFTLTRKAFDVADAYQVPVIILTDQYLMDSYYNTEEIKFGAAEYKRHLIKTVPGYKRYARGRDGISPRGIPGYGAGIVCVDSDEHTEDGYITESHAVRIAMVEKRLNKERVLLNDAIMPELVGPERYESLAVCWGTNYHPVREALEKKRSKTMAMLHFSQLYPLHPGVISCFERAERIIVVENNATGQFGRLLRGRLGIEPVQQVLKFDGAPFSVEELITQLDC